MSRHHHGARIHDYTSRGYRVVALENAIVRVEILADKGSDIVGFLHKPTDTEFMWHRPTGLPAAPIASIPRGVDEHVFVDLYEGGGQGGARGSAAGPSPPSPMSPWTSWGAPPRRSGRRSSTTPAVSTCRPALVPPTDPSRGRAAKWPTRLSLTGRWH